LILGAGLIQISPIKLDPFSWVMKKIGNALNADLVKSLKETDKAIKDIANRLQDHIDENQKEQIDECRRRILNFNEKILTGTPVSKERYDSILDDIDMYEQYCKDHPKYPNSKAVLSIQNLKQDYSQRYQIPGSNK